MRIKIKYHNDDIERIKKMRIGDWIDLRAAEDVELWTGDYAMIKLGVSMKLPDGYEAHLLPRSSTFRNYGILQTNSMGIIDNSYCGDGDEWAMAVYATRKTTIKKNARICQFRIVKVQEEVEFEEVDKLSDNNRGGFGSTGV